VQESAGQREKFSMPAPACEIQLKCFRLKSNLIKSENVLSVSKNFIIRFVHLIGFC
jgi:hypothetical protein